MPGATVSVWARVALPGFHHWPDATLHRAYLAGTHRHLFIITAWVRVAHTDRDTEFHDLADAIRSWWGPGTPDWGPASCESLAAALAAVLADQGMTVTRVDVSEDGESGATYTPGKDPQMPFEISKTFTFAAGHRLTGLPESHKCSRFHGHGYTVEVRITAPALERTGPGFVLDYGDLDPFADWLAATFDHRWLGSGTIGLINDDGTVSQVTKPVFYENPTAELLAAYFAQRLPELVPAAAGMDITVGVAEGPKTWAWAR